jgi:hypothetical protein
MLLINVLGRCGKMWHDAGVLLCHHDLQHSRTFVIFRMPLAAILLHSVFDLGSKMKMKNCEV